VASCSLVENDAPQKKSLVNILWCSGRTPSHHLQDKRVNQLKKEGYWYKEGRTGTFWYLFTKLNGVTF